MGLPIERWARNAHPLEAAPPRLADDLDLLRQFSLLRAERSRTTWKQQLAEIRSTGDPTALLGGFAGLGASPAPALAAVTGGAANVAWWSPTIYSPIPANSLQAPEAFRINASGTVTSSATTQTLTLNPALGTAVAGAALGASPALSLGGGAAVSNALWQIEGDITVRTVGAPGANSTAVGVFQFAWGGAAGAVASSSVALFGLTATASFDATIASGFLMAATPSAAGVSVTPLQVHFSSWN